MINGKCYVVWVGRIPGIYASWSETNQQVTGYPNAKFKKFNSYELAYKAFFTKKRIKSEKKPVPVKVVSKPEVKIKEYLDTCENVDIHIYCDGACEPNPGECGTGISVYNDLQLTELFYGLYKEKGTNNIAELNGLLYSLKIAKKYLDENKTVQILCDSRYAIDCITSWAYIWKQNNWMKKKEPVKNPDIIKEAHELYDSIKDKVKVSHIKGHFGFEGNEVADRLSLLAIKRKECHLKRYDGVIELSKILDNRWEF